MRIEDFAGAWATRVGPGDAATAAASNPHRIARAKGLAAASTAIGALLAFAATGPAWLDASSAAARPAGSASTPASSHAIQGTRQIIRLAQAGDPLNVKPSVEIAAGARMPVPVSINAQNAPVGQFIVVYSVPDWLSFTNAQRASEGIWLIDKSALASTQLVAGDAATGQREISFGATDASGRIAWTGNARVKVAQPSATAAAAAPAPSAPPVEPAQPAAPAPAATAAAAAPPTDAAAGDGDGKVTWQQMLKSAATAKPDAPAPADVAPAAPAASESSGGAKSDAELVREAKHLVRECTTCHNLYGTDVGIPVMVGLTVDRFIDTIDAYRREKRDHKLMQVIAKSLTEEQTRALALYLGRIKPVEGTGAGGGDGAAARDPSGSPFDPTDSPAPAGQASAPPSAAASLDKRRVADQRTQARIARWIERGEDMLKNGDIAQARLLLERASEYGDARAAFLMASSFDPNVLPWRAGMGMVAEPAKARRWYMLARDLGAGGDVEQRLLELP